MKRSTLLIAVLALAAGVIAAQFILPPATQSQGNGTIARMEAGKFGGDFSLQNNGKPVKLSDFQGKMVVMYFGYSSCPDVCPTTLGLIGATLKQLKPEEVAQIQPVFISVDPERDSGERLMAYAQHFYPTFIGLTGTPEEVKKATGQYGAFFAKVESESAMGYLVDHTSKTYLISKDGKYVNILPHDMSMQDLTDAIRSGL